MCSDAWINSQHLFDLCFLDCFINETTKFQTNETRQFTKLLDRFYACVANASQVC